MNLIIVNLYDLNFDYDYYYNVVVVVVDFDLVVVDLIDLIVVDLDKLHENFLILFDHRMILNILVKTSRTTIF